MTDREPTPRDHAESWLRALFASSDIVEFRAIPTDRSSGLRPQVYWATGGDHAAALDRMESLNAAGLNVYAGVCPRTEQQGTADHVAIARALWLDFDGKPDGTYYSREEVAEILAGRMPAPSMLVASGHGIHAYWLLKEPMPATDAEAVLQVLAPRPNTGRHPVVPGADPKSTDRARILRVPGFMNHKPPPAPSVILSWPEDGPRWTLSDVLAASGLGSIEAVRATLAERPPAPAGDTPAPAPTQRRQGNGAPSAMDRARKWIERRDPAVQGAGGDEWTFKTACAMVRGFRLTDDEAMDLLLAWNNTCAPPWSRSELAAKIQSARKHGREPYGYLLDQERPGPAGRPPAPRAAATGGDESAPPEEQPPDDPSDVPELANHTVRELVLEGGKTTTARDAIHIDAIVREVLASHGDDLGRVGENLFVARERQDATGKIISFMSSADDVFGWLHHKYGAVRWKDGGLDSSGRSFVSRAEYVGLLSRCAKGYLGVSAYPFEPARSDVFTRWQPEPGYEPDGSHLSAFLAFFRPATETDADLVAALVLTLFWGGQPGGRPLFVIAPEESGNQQGIGKTELAVQVSGLVGGYMDLVAPKRGRFADALAKQALEEINLPYRVALLDNTTGVLRDDDMARLVTAPKIGGRASYAKQSERANLITWIITTNEASLSTDLSCRSVLIRLRPCDREADPGWPRRVREYIREHGRRVAMDCMAQLAAVGDVAFARHTRFPDWDRAVLAALNDRERAVKHILEQQRNTDVDADEIREFLLALQDKHDAPPHSNPVEVKTQEIMEVWNDLHGREFTSQQIVQAVKNAAARGQLRGSDGLDVLEYHKRSSRYWLFRPWAISKAEDEKPNTTEKTADANF